METNFSHKWPICPQLDEWDRPNPGNVGVHHAFRLRNRVWGQRFPDPEETLAKNPSRGLTP
jgi:hypothetical protein